MSSKSAEPEYAQPLEPHPGALGSGYVFRCPICASRRRLNTTPAGGLHILCTECLGILVVAEAQPKMRPFLTIRAITEDDIKRMASDVHLALLEAKSRRLRHRTESGDIPVERQY